MRKPKPLEQWDAALTRYLDTRRALGRLYAMDERILIDLRAFLVRTGRKDLDQDGFEAWRKQFFHLSPATRVCREGAAYRFCRYRHRFMDPSFYVPDPSTLARAGRRPLPTILTTDDVTRLLAYTDGLKPIRGHVIRGEVLRMAIVLLYTTGMRRGELAHLMLGDVDERSAVVRITGTKFHKSRWVPLSETAAGELRCYLWSRRRSGYPCASADPLLCRVGGRPISSISMAGLIKCALKNAGIRNAAGRVPHTHDFRHSFAVGALLRWYQAGADVQINLPKLATYMGHVSVVSTAYYLRHMPAVVEQASARFSRSYEQILQGGAS